MRHILTTFFFIIVPVVAIFINSCENTSNNSAADIYNIQGLLELDEPTDFSLASVRLFQAPDDNTINQLIGDFPSLAFLPISPMLFNPNTQIPVKEIIPDENGNFTFDDVYAGSYIVDAQLDGYACPQPVSIDLPGDGQAVTLLLASIQEVAGNLNSTTWESGKAYKIIEDVLILPEALLTIEEGVIIQVAGDYKLTVTGGLIISGTAAAPVRFVLTADHFLSGGDWGGIRVDHLNYPVNNCSIEGMLIRGAFTAFQISGGAPQISRCLFDTPAGYGVYFKAEAEGSIESSIVKDGVQGFVADNSNPQFRKNIVLRMSSQGITVKNNSQAVIEQNAVVDCQTAVWSDDNTAPLIAENYFSGGSYAIDAQSGFWAVIQNNVFSQQSEICIYFHVGYCYPLIENNNFINMPSTILYSSGFVGQQSDTLYAPNNYWDGDDAVSIPSRIVDGHDIGSPDNPVGLVDYNPFRLSQISGAGP